MNTVKVKIKIHQTELSAELYNTDTGKAIYENLPLKGNVNVWGDEIYFTVPISLPEEKSASEHTAIGDLAFWPVGSAFCIFFGPTPVSIDERPRAYSPVNIFGKISSEISSLKSIKQDDEIWVSKV